MAHSQSQATIILADFTKKVQPVIFRLRDAVGKRLRIQAEVYLLNDILNKDKFFVAMKFIDLDRKVWIRTRVSMKNEAIFETKIPILREWTLVEKAIEQSLPLVTLQTDKLRSLLKYKEGKTLPTCLPLSSNEAYLVEQIIAKLLYYFQHKFCISQKISGTVLTLQTTSAKKQTSLNTYFHDKHAPKMPFLWPQVLKLEQVSWEILKKLNKQFIKDGDLEPVGINMNTLIDPFHKKDPRVRGMEDLDIQPDEITSNKDIKQLALADPSPFITPSAMMEFKPVNKRGSKRFSIPNAAKVFIKFRQGQREYHGWQKPKFNVEWTIPKITLNLMTVVVKMNGLFWLNTVLIEPTESKETSDDLLQDFEAKLVQFHFPFSTDRKWIGVGSLEDMPKALALPRKVLLNFIGTRLGGVRIYRSMFDRVNHHMSEFIGKSI
jgi:hypothetical protein